MTTNSDVDRAVAVLRSGGLVAFPTETVYGLGADALNETAVAQVFAVKGRPTEHPLIVHLAGADQLALWAAEVPDAARVLADRFWPGPLTIVLQRPSHVPAVTTGGLPTIGLRVPAHEVALELLRAFGGGIAAPSANRFGAVSPTTAQHVRDDLGSAVALILDGGPCAVGVESTIVDLSSGDPAVLRPGGISVAAIEEALGRSVPVREGGPVLVSGRFPSHYAPRARVILAPCHEHETRIRSLQAEGLRVGVLGFATPNGRERADREPGGDPGCDPGSGADHVVTIPGTHEDVARDLYRALRDLDARGCDVILTDVPEARGLGLAIGDRLRRAAGPR